METINVAFASDEKYLAPTYISVSSLVDSCSPEYEYAIYILVPENVSQKRRDVFSHLESENVSIKFIDISPKDEQFIMSDFQSVAHISNVTYYRFYLPSLLTDIDKCLYIDGDTIVMSDISEIYNVNIDNYYVAGTRNIFFAEPNPNWYSARCSELNVPSLDQYINAGVTLMNLKKLRDDKLHFQMITLAETKKFLYNDQDIINSVCYGKILLLEPRCNTLLSYLTNVEITKTLFDFDYLDSTSNPIILHYASAEKPWISRFNPYAKPWWKTYDKQIPKIKKEFLDLFLDEYRKKNTVFDEAKRIVKNSRIYHFVKREYKRIFKKLH